MPAQRPRRIRYPNGEKICLHNRSMGLYLTNKNNFALVITNANVCKGENMVHCSSLRNKAGQVIIKLTQEAMESIVLMSQLIRERKIEPSIGVKEFEEQITGKEA